MRQNIDYLYAVGDIFTSGNNLDDLLKEAIELTLKKLSIIRLMVHIYQDDIEEIVVDIYSGYSADEIKRGVYKKGEGIVGKVISDGKPVIIPRIGSCPEFLNKTGSRSTQADLDGAFVCVPVRLKDNTIGTISADFSDVEEDFLSYAAEQLAVIAILSAHEISSRIEKQKSERQLVEENRRLNARLSEKIKNIKIIGNSVLMHELFEKIALVSETNTTVLITGESGTGKELVADAIQKNSLRSDKPFIKVNVAALPENLIESELFGHEKGSFTGAVQTKKGRFELANGGTIFLDEIGDLALPLQVKLLRVLQERFVERVGGVEPIPIDVRVIAATHQNLEKKIELNEFRSDLYYRLNVFPVNVPALRERKADILALVNHFCEKFSKETQKSINRVSSEAIDMLVAYHWPGNIRELENCINRAVILAEEGVIRSYHLPPTLQIAENVSGSSSFENMVNNFEKEIIIDYLKITEGNISKAAEMLGTTKRILTYKVKKLEIDCDRFKKIRS
ncbi:MAG: sigma 54-interacting transcriptional regulator [Spirochaetes bacterium]|nr:sigma 54-interacting transcriptional regulator [Spirochaetota bacterium]MBN2771175.1 sigma 54-interacting transcriptional regulator [Spirochaetota bacterium]